MANTLIRAVSLFLFASLAVRELRIEFIFWDLLLNLSRLPDLMEVSGLEPRRLAGTFSDVSSKKSLFPLRVEQDLLLT